MNCFDNAHKSDTTLMQFENMQKTQFGGVFCQCLSYKLCASELVDILTFCVL